MLNIPKVAPPPVHFFKINFLKHGIIQVDNHWRGSHRGRLDLSTVFGLNTIQWQHRVLTIFKGAVGPLQRPVSSAQTSPFISGFPTVKYVNSGRESSEDARWTRMHVLYQLDNGCIGHAQENN